MAHRNLILFVNTVARASFVLFLGLSFTGACAGKATTGTGVHRPPLNHRAEATACDRVRPPGNFGSSPAPAGFDAGIGCTSDAQCTSGENGRCMIERVGGICTYDGCFADTDCTGDNATTKSPVCECETDYTGANTCLGEGNCRVDADCGSSRYCSPTFGTCGHYSGIVGYYCHTAEDECVDDSDCASDGDVPGGYCAFLPEIGHWKCSTSECVG
jgi:hypothetical protein